MFKRDMHLCGIPYQYASDEIDGDPLPHMFKGVRDNYVHVSPNWASIFCSLYTTHDIGELTDIYMILTI